MREVERLTSNPGKLANADGRCWKDTTSLGRKRSFKTHRPPYPTRRGRLVTAWQETKKLLHDESGWTMSGRTWRGKYPKTTRTGKTTKNQTKRKSGKVLWEPHRRHSRRTRRKRRRRRLQKYRPTYSTVCLRCDLRRTLLLKQTNRLNSTKRHWVFTIKTKDNRMMMLSSLLQFLLHALVFCNVKCVLNNSRPSKFAESDCSALARRVFKGPGLIWPTICWTFAYCCSGTFISICKENRNNYIKL